MRMENPWFFFFLLQRTMQWKAKVYMRANEKTKTHVYNAWTYAHTNDSNKQMRIYLCGSSFYSNVLLLFTLLPPLLWVSNLLKWLLLSLENWRACCKSWKQMAEPTRKIICINLCELVGKSLLCYHHRAMPSPTSVEMPRLQLIWKICAVILRFLQPTAVIHFYQSFNPLILISIRIVLVRIICVFSFSHSNNWRFLSIYNDSTFNVGVVKIKYL